MKRKSKQRNYIIEEGERMKKVTGLKNGYYIRIIDGFYEVIDGNKCVFYGYCRKNTTVKEIANKKQYILPYFMSLQEDL